MNCQKPRLTFQIERTLVGVMVAALCVELMVGATAAQAPIAEATRARVRALQASRSAIETILVDGRMIRGRIMTADDDSFTMGEEKTNRVVALRYAQVLEVKKKRGLSGNTKAGIAAAMIGGALVVLCFAPFPLGFLCQEDPS